MRMPVILVVSALLTWAACIPFGIAADVATQPATAPATATAPAGVALAPTNGDPFPATYKLSTGEVLSSLNVQNPPPGPGPKLSGQAGTHITALTDYPEEKIKVVVFSWKDKTFGDVSRRVIITPDTVINFNGKMAKYEDLTEARAKTGAVVATLNTTGVYAVIVRFEHGLLTDVSTDALSEKQQAALKAVTPVATTQSNQSFEKNAAGIVAALKLNDPVKEKVVYEAVLKQTEVVRDAHNLGFGPSKASHDELIASLKSVLTPEQIDQVKDALTNNLFPPALKAVTDANKDLNPEDLKAVTAILVETREKAMDLKNAEEQKPLFDKAKPQVKAYLTAHGH